MAPSGHISSSLAALALEAVRAAGLDPSELASEAKLSLAELADPDVSIPLAKYIALWTAVASRPAGQGVGLQCLDTTRLSLAGSFGYAIRNAETVGHALSLVTRHGRVVGAPLLPTITIAGGRLSLSARWWEPLSRNRPFGESAFATIVGLIREITGVQPVPVEMRFQFSRPEDAERSARLFGCEAIYDCEESLLSFSEDVAKAPVQNRDPALFAFMDRYAQRLAGALGATDAQHPRLPPVDGPTLLSEVRAVLRSELLNGEPSIGSIARNLAMSERTLQRRLGEQGQTVSGLVDEIRHELSLRYLNSPDLSISEVAFLLGYSDSTSFQRAFRRWTGKAPASYRREGRARGP